MDIKLEDKYKLSEGTRFLTGAQALVRVPIVQARRDKKKNLITNKTSALEAKELKIEFNEDMLDVEVKFDK